MLSDEELKVWAWKNVMPIMKQAATFMPLEQLAGIFIGLGVSIALDSEMTKDEVRALLEGSLKLHP